MAIHVSLPQIFVVQSALIIGAMVGIIVSFALVTNSVINSTVETAIDRNLNTVESNIDSLLLQTEPLARQAAQLVTALKQEGPYNQVVTPALLTYLTPYLTAIVAMLYNNPKFEYVYQSYQTSPSGRWADLNCGNQSGLYTCTVGTIDLVDLYLNANTLPLNTTIFAHYSSDPTDEPYIVQISSLTEANVAHGFWQRGSNYYDENIGTQYTLMTYSVPIYFSPTTGRCVLSQSIDLNLASVGRSLANLVNDGSLLMLVDGRFDDLLATSLPQYVLPSSNITGSGSGAVGQLWSAFTAPNDQVTDSAFAALNAADGGTFANQTGSGVVHSGDNIISFRHVYRGSLHWVIINRTPQDYYFGQSRRLTTILVVIASVVTVICAAALVAVYFAVVRPISSLSIAMGKISRLEDNTAYSTADSPALLELRPMHEAYKKLDVAIQSFTRYVPRGVVKELIDSNQLCKLAMAPMRCSILFADIKSFTTISERLSASVLSELIHAYFNRMTRIVLKHNGMVDKFIGDCIMAVWSAPLPQEHHEVSATLCALLLNRECHSDPLSTLFDNQGEHLAIRVGVNSGEVLAGNMGSDERMNYTVIGDSVNLAARLEAFNKTMCTEVMISEFVAEQLFDKFCLRLLCSVSVVGKEQPVEVYEPLGLYPNATHHLPQIDDKEYHNAIDSNLSLRDARERRAYMKREGSVCSTVNSDKHSSEESSDVGRRERAASTLLRHARTIGLVATDEEILWAAKYSAAVHDYRQGLFAAALDELQELQKRYPHRTGTKEYDRFVGECEKCIRHLPEDFDGVFKATEK